jgi:hypothetical protein
MDSSLVNEEEYDIIKKPRTNFTNNALRRAIPNLNVQDKLGSISMNKLNVLSAMRLGTGSQSTYIDKKIRSVSSLPKMQSLDSSMMKVILPNDENKKDAKKMLSGGLD